MLSLLVIPAIVLIYYFKKFSFSFNGFIIANISAVLLLGFIYNIIIPQFVNLAGKFEIFFMPKILFLYKELVPSVILSYKSLVLTVFEYWVWTYMCPSWTYVCPVWHFLTIEFVHTCVQYGHMCVQYGHTFVQLGHTYVPLRVTSTG